MLRTILLLAIGAALGATGVHFVLDGREADASKPWYADAAADVDSSGDASSAQPARQLALYAAVADIDSASELEALLSRTVAQPFSPTRDAEIRALFARLVELDLERALRVAGTPGFDPVLVTDVFRIWAERDAEAALRGLAAIRSRMQQSAAALAVLEVVGSDAGSIERIAAALPVDQRIGFQAQALAKRAESDPHGALGEALALNDPAARSTAAQRVGIAWVQYDPRSAYLRTDSLPTELQVVYRDTVTTEWARLDTPDFLDFLVNEPQLDHLLLGVGHAMAYDPRGLYELARTKPPTQFYSFGTIDSVAFGVAAAVDPEYARNVVTTLGSSQRELRVVNAFAENYARSKPDEALEWARSFNPIRPGLEASVIAQTTLADLDKGLELLAEFNPPQNHPAVAAGVATPNYIANLVGQAAAADQQRTEMANKLLARSDEAGAALVLRRLMTRWVETDPVSALDWMLDNESAIETELVGSIGSQLAARDAKTAAQFLSRMPPELKPVWLQQVASAYAQQDPRNAATWIVQFQGEPGYDNLWRQVIAQSAQADPPGAAFMLSSAPAEIQRSAASSVASGWARQDLAAAASWVLGLSDEAAQRNALSTVAQAWAARDPAAAQRWAASLPSGDARDRALSSVLGRVMREGGELDRAFMNAFGSDAVRERQLVSQIGNVAFSDPQRAETLLRTWVSDAALRAEGERMIEDVQRRYGL